MKKALLIALLGLFVAGSAYAVPERTGHSDLGFNVSAAIPSDSSTDTAVYVGGTYAYGVNEWLALGVSSGWAQFDDSTTGELTEVPLLGEIILRVPVAEEQQIQPYGVLGLGIAFFDFDESATVRASNVEVEVDDAFAVKVGGGVDWFADEHWIVNLEVSYIFADTDVSARNTVTGASASISNVDADNWFVGGGLKYRF